MQSPGDVFSYNIGLTPLFKTTDSARPSVCTVKVGVDLLKTYRLVAKRKAKGN